VVGRLHAQLEVRLWADRRLNASLRMRSPDRVETAPDDEDEKEDASYCPV
jgi:hypothetical protein